jgi:aspartate carbamoyltransferase catalytic subunit
MRTVRSLLIMLSRFSKAIEEVVVITDVDTPFSPDQREELEKAGLRLSVTADMKTVLPTLDIVYINAIAWKGNDFEFHGGRFALDADSPFKANAIVLHPLARGEELDRSLDSTPYNWYFAQARGAVFVRMALLSAMLKTYV